MSKPSFLYVALHEKTGAEVISGTESLSAGQLRFMARVKQGPPTTRWLDTIEHVLKFSAGKPWGLDISKQYFVSPNLKFGWRIIIQCQDMAVCLQHLVEAVKAAQVKAAEHVEYDVPLTGSPNRSPTAGLMGHVVVGPAAVRT